MAAGRGARHRHCTPFGYAPERYVYAFMVAIMLFSLGGSYAPYEGYHTVIDPHPLTSPLAALVVLLLAACLKGHALRTALGQANLTRGNRSWLRFVRRTRSPEPPVILLEDGGALLGLLFALISVGLSVMTGNGVYDGIATLCIAAVLLAVETKA